MVFLGKKGGDPLPPRLRQAEIGRWVHIGDGNSIRCHEGSLRIGARRSSARTTRLIPLSSMLLL